MLIPVLFLLSVANIEVFRDSVIGEISPYLFATGDEMNEDFSQDGVDSLVSFTGIPLLRMGGIAAEYLDWEANDYNGVWYVDFVDTFIIQNTLNYGIDSLLRFCERVDVEPILTVNFQINDPSKSARLVEYCNGDTNTPMGAIRASRGHPEPYNVVYWCIGNEPDISGSVWPVPPYGNWTFYRHFGIPFNEWSWKDSSFATSSDFSTLVDVYIDSMRAHSPIPLKIGGLSLAGNLSWISTVIGENNNKIDWMDIHYYPNASLTADSNLYREWLASPDTGGSLCRLPVEKWYRQVCDSVEKYNGGHNIPVYIFEFNSGMIMAEDPLWWDYLDGLFIADVLGHFANAGVPGAAVYSIYEGEPDSDEFPHFGIIRGDTISLRMPAHVLKLYLNFFGDTAIKTTSDVFGLNVYGSIKGNDTLSIIVVNKNLDSTYTAIINLHGFVSNDTIKVWDITNDTTLAAPWNGTKGIIYRGKYSGDSTTFIYTFPKTSVTSLIISPKSSAIEENVGQSFSFAKIQISPTPFISLTSIKYSIAGTGNVELKIYNLAGELVRTLVDGQQKAGNYTISYDGKDDRGKFLPSGIYFIKLKTGNFAQTRKLLLLR
jgi:hypothetical protein